MISNTTLIMTTTTRIILISIYNWGDEFIIPFKNPPGGDIGDGDGRDDIPGRLRLFVFSSGTRKEKVNHNNEEEKTLLILLTVND